MIDTGANHHRKGQGLIRSNTLATDLLVFSRQEWESPQEWNPKLKATLEHDLRWLIAPDAA